MKGPFSPLYSLWRPEGACAGRQGGDIPGEERVGRRNARENHPDPEPPWRMFHPFTETFSAPVQELVQQQVAP